MFKKLHSTRVGCKKIFSSKRMLKDLVHNNNGNGKAKNIDFSKYIYLHNLKKSSMKFGCLYSIV
jgi:hypothetical protein